MTQKINLASYNIENVLYITNIIEAKIVLTRKYYETPTKSAKAKYYVQNIETREPHLNS